MEDKKKLIDLLKENGTKYSTYQLFNDLCEFSMCKLNSPLEGGARRLEQLARLQNKYGEDYSMLDDMYDALKKEIEDAPFTDVLGDTYMCLSIAKEKEFAQHFTPDNLAELASSFNWSTNAEQEIKRKGFIYHNDVCCGSGSLSLAFAKKTKKEGYDPQTQLCFLCGDIDPLCVNMAYAQLALNKIPAVVQTGDILTQNYTDWMCTPQWESQFKLSTFIVKK